MIKGSCDLEHLKVSNHLAKFDGHRLYGSALDITFSVVEEHDSTCSPKPAINQMAWKPMASHLNGSDICQTQLGQQILRNTQSHFFSPSKNTAMEKNKKSVKT